MKVNELNLAVEYASSTILNALFEVFIRQANQKIYCFRTQLI